MKNCGREEISIIILFIIIAFGGVIFFMRDKSPGWCNLSLGTYDIQNSVPVRDSFGFTDYDQTFGCYGGIFGFMDKWRP